MNDDDRVDVTGKGKYRRIEVKRTVNAPIQRVWSAITNAEELGQWWDPGVIEPREGGRIKLDMDTDECGGLPLDGEVKVFLPPYVFEFTWHEEYDPAKGVVRFDLIELDGDRTLVTLTNLVPFDDTEPASAGWQEIMGSLVKHFQKAA